MLQNPFQTKKRCSLWGQLIEVVTLRRMSSAKRYLVSGGIALGGIGCAHYLVEATGVIGIPITTLATILASLFGGFGPGVMAALLSAVGLDLFVVEPYGLLGSGYLGFLRMAMFAGISLLVSLLVSGLKNALQLAEAAKAEAESANEEKDAVMAILSHDLRGPLTTLSLSFQLIKKFGELGGKEEEISRVSANGVLFCKRMSDLIQNLLDASKVAAGGMTLSHAVCDLRELVNEVFAEHRLLAEP
jgi:K+-sensing histidine kinase KdpD